MSGEFRARQEATECGARSFGKEIKSAITRERTKSFMCKSKPARLQLSAKFCLSALLGLPVALLPFERAQADSDTTTCQPGMQNSMHVTPGVAHIGNIVTIDAVNAAVAGNSGNPFIQGGCDLTNAVTFLVKPDNSFQLVITNCFLKTGAGNANTPVFSCPSGQGTLGNSGGACI